MKTVTRSVLSLSACLLIGVGAIGALPGCMNQGSRPAPNEEKRLLETYTGRIELISNGVVIDRPGQPIPLCFVEMTLDPPGKDGRRKVELEARGGPQIHVVVSDWHVGDKISFEAYAEEFFKSDRPVRMAVLKNIRIIEHAPTPEPGPGPATGPTGAEKIEDGSKEPWAPPPGAGKLPGNQR